MFHRWYEKLQRCNSVVCPRARFALFPARLDETCQALVQVICVDDREQPKTLQKPVKRKCAVTYRLRVEGAILRSGICPSDLRAFFLSSRAAAFRTAPVRRLSREVLFVPILAGSARRQDSKRFLRKRM